MLNIVYPELSLEPSASVSINCCFAIDDELPRRNRFGSLDDFWQPLRIINCVSVKDSDFLVLFHNPNTCAVCSIGNNKTEKA